MTCWYEDEGVLQKYFLSVEQEKQTDLLIKSAEPIVVAYCFSCSFWSEAQFVKFQALDTSSGGRACWDVTVLGRHSV